MINFPDPISLKQAVVELRQKAVVADMVKLTADLHRAMRGDLSTLNIRHVMLNEHEYRLAFDRLPMSGRGLMKDRITSMLSISEVHRKERRCSIPDEIDVGEIARAFFESNWMSMPTPVCHRFMQIAEVGEKDGEWNQRN